MPRRYVVKSQSRRSLLIWKLFGRRLDGLPREATAQGGKVATHRKRPAVQTSISSGSIMPPPTAVGRHL